MSDREGIFNVYLDLRAGLSRMLMRIVPPPAVEDIVQETYVRACQVEKQGSDIREPRAMLYRVARNLALDYLKRADTRLTVSADEQFELAGYDVAQEADQTFEAAASDEEFALFCEAVRELPVQCRRVFVMKKVYGYSQREIAQVFDLSESTVEKHVARGIYLCARFMQQHNPGYSRTGRHRTAKQGANASGRAGQ